MIYAMHVQQAWAVRSVEDWLEIDLLREFQESERLVASVTSEYGKGGDVTKALAPLEYAGSHVLVRRKAPIVSYGEHADSFLILMKKTAEAPDRDTCLVIASRSHGVAHATGPWDSCGMRGTRSVPMEFDLRVGRERVAVRNVSAVIARAFVPAGHIAWASAWLGAATGLLTQSLEVAADSSRLGAMLASDAYREAIGRVRADLAAIRALRDRCLHGFEQIQYGRRAYDYEFAQEISCLKVFASETALKVAQALQILAGAHNGYVRAASIPIERTVRDLLAAPLMYPNRLLTSAIATLEAARIRKIEDPII
ncbi:Acyl-CoA dehydrogenase, C-terminal domain [Klebsiella pneumoniae]|nr:Acyl-CoA dehydrogenase, C-terminal domain [Klebsiella pneumoniae]